MPRTYPKPEPTTPAQLKSQRLSLGLTQSQLAQMLGFHADAVHHWECGHHRPSKLLTVAMRHVTSQHRAAMRQRQSRARTAARKRISDAVATPAPYEDGSFI